MDCRQPGPRPFRRRRARYLDACGAVKLLAEVGAYGVNFHDNDLVPIDATPPSATGSLPTSAGLRRQNIKVPMATVNLFYYRFSRRRFYRKRCAVRAYAIQKTMRAMDLGAEFGAEILVLWAAARVPKPTPAADRRGDQTSPRGPQLPLRIRITQGYGYKFAMEAKPNEPRGDIYMPTNGAYLGFIETLEHTDMVGVNPEVAHEHMPGLNMTHAIAQAWEAGKLFHIDLNDQVPGATIRTLRFGSAAQRRLFGWSSFSRTCGTPACGISTLTPTAPRITRASGILHGAACAPIWFSRTRPRSGMRTRAYRGSWPT